MPSWLPWQNQSCCTTRLCGIGRLPKMVKGVCAPRINHERCPSSKGGHHTQSHLLSRQPCPPQHSPALGRCTHVSCRRQNGTFKMSPAKRAKVDAEISGVLGFFASVKAINHLSCCRIETLFRNKIFSKKYSISISKPYTDCKCFGNGNEHKNAQVLHIQRPQLE